jgi:PAS domain S-box-containing protein
MDQYDAAARLTAILDAAFDSIISMDADGRIVEVNQAAEEMFGYTADQMVGQDLADLIIPPHLREPHRRGLEHYVKTGTGRMVGHPVELPAMRADGSEFPVEIAVTRPQLPGPPLFTGFLRDVTERRRDEHALRTLAAEQAALRRVATTVASETDQARVFAVVTEELGRLLGAETANMIRFEPEGDAVVCAAWSIGKTRNVPVGTFISLSGDSVSALIHKTGRPERVDDFSLAGGETATMLRRLGYRAAVGTPIRLGGRLWGAVIVSTANEEPFPEGSENRIASFAELVAQALANAEARQELADSRARIVQAGDEERRRLERNLHDGAQQRLVALSLELRLVERKLATGDPMASELLKQASDDLAGALEELRELARGIHPAILSDKGLVPALEMLAGRATVPVELCAALDCRLPPPVEAAAYYLVAEALTNAAKHSQATAATVRLSVAGGRVRVRISDDGTGGAAVRACGGLRGLAERLEELGGELEVDSPAGAGTSLTGVIPLARGD